MRKNLLLALLPISLAIATTSCVSNQKFLQSKARVSSLQEDSTKTHNSLNDCYATVNNLKNENASLTNKNTAVTADYNTLSDDSKSTIEDQAKRLKNLQTTIQAQKDVMDKLKASIANALLNFKDDEISVYIKNGNVYVSLEEKLLFKSGSDVVDPKGKEALKSLAKVINSSNEFTVVVEGHTDNVPIKTKKFQDNWALSTARANSILRVLTNDYGFNPTRITAAGKSQYHPVSTNSTEAGRAANRRTLIVLSPDLKDLFLLLD